MIRSDDGWSSSARSGYRSEVDDRRYRDHSPDDHRRADRGAYGGLPGRRSRSRDDLMDLERDRHDHGARRGRDHYDDSFLREALEKKKMSEQQRTRSRDRLDSESERSDRGRAPPLPHNPPSGLPGRRDDYPPPPPPPYSEDESVSSAKKSNLRKVSQQLSHLGKKKS